MENILNQLIKASDNLIITYKDLFLELLEDEEQIAFTYTESLQFKDGCWYRPIHNIIVPLSMKIILKGNSSINKDLIFAAILHDIGYSKINIEKTLKGADWENVDKRETHMKAGEMMANNFLSKENILSDDRRTVIKEIISEHDNPYIGKTFQNQESIYVRDADLSFVPTAVSFYKDFIAYKAKDKELELEDFLYKRLVNFYDSYYEVPLKIKNLINEEKFIKTKKNGFHFESPKTESGKDIINFFLLNRAKEVLLNKKTLDLEFFLYSLEEDLKVLKDKI